jgi:hypothetical protein
MRRADAGELAQAGCGGVNREQRPDVGGDRGGSRHTGAMTAATFAIDAGRPGVQRLEVWNRRLPRR